MKAGDIAVKCKYTKTGEEGWIKLEDIARIIFETIAECNYKKFKETIKQENKEK